MMKKNLRSIAACAGALALSLALLGGCSASPAQQKLDSANVPASSQLASGGVINLKVNPAIAISYDDAGEVTDLSALNADAEAVLAGYANYEGRDARVVTSELVTLIGEAGYFIDDIEGRGNDIIIEIERGSVLPYGAFLSDIASDVQKVVKANRWHTPIDVVGESDYGMTDYIDTDYGPGNDGNSDYADVTDYAGNTDFGPGNNGSTDYDDTDYGPNADGVTDYDATDYGPQAAPAKPTSSASNAPAKSTDYDDTNYGSSPYDDATDYGNSNYGNSDYND